MSSYEGFIQIEHGELIITHKKPAQAGMYINETDPFVINQAKDTYNRRRSNTLKNLSFRLKKPIDENNGLINEHVLDKDINVLGRIRLKRSMYSCNLN